MSTKAGMPIAAVLVMVCGPADVTLIPVGDELQVSTVAESYCHSPRVAVDVAGGFLVVWQSSNADRHDPTGYDFVIDGAAVLAVGSDAAGNFAAPNPASEAWADVAVTPGGNLFAVYDGDTITATDALRILGAAVAAGPPVLFFGASS